MSTPKEMSYFSKDEVYARGAQWYANLFAGAKPSQVCGEASTTYSRWPTYDKTVSRLADAQPDAKLVYLLRNPVDRLFSFYAHRMRAEVTTTFEEFLDSTPEATESGRYMTQINKFLERFSRQQICVLFTEDLRANPGHVLDTLRSFLSLAEFDFMHAGPIVANEGGGKFYAATALNRTISALKRAPAMSPLLKRVPSSVRKSGYEWLANGPVGRKLRKKHRSNMSSLTPQLRKRLLAMYISEIEALEEFTGRNLDHWKREAA